MLKNNPLGWSPKRSFNGAALVGVRNVRRMAVRAIDQEPASTGPHSLECGMSNPSHRAFCANASFNGAALVGVRNVVESKVLPFATHGFNGAALVGVRNVVNEEPHVRRRMSLQRGRTRWSAEWCILPPRKHPPPPPLQRGRTRWSAECPAAWEQRLVQPCRFNGAALVGVRNVRRCHCSGHRPRLLQRGRTRWSAE